MPVATLATPYFLCPVCGAVDDRLAPGPGGRPSASCRTCQSLERQRLLALLLGAFAKQALLGRTVLDVAPSPQMSALIRELNPAAYLGVDFDPKADGRLVDVVASLTDLPLAPDSVGLMVCYHVLEHIPDDLAAMREIARVLPAGGVALVQVPWRPGPTDEDPSASPQERLRRFGQADHVRWYGDEFDERLSASGLDVMRLESADLVPEHLMRLLGIDPGEIVWVCTRAGSPAVDLSVAREAITQSLPYVLARVARTGVERARPPVAEPQPAPAPTAPAPTPPAAPAWERLYRRARAGRLGQVAADVSRPLRRRLRR